ncbi:MAG TPA: ATP-binding protein [Acidimicrobiales bacterium]|nr:ATP-binding protein [Acidimicrobiales bacterium]
MAGYVPPQLHPLLGRDIDAITEADLERLVGAPETEWFDAKRDPYGNSDAQKRELASDVAAFANRQGGLIIVGLEEDGSGIITELTPLAEADFAGEELRMTQIISSLVAPVPTFTVSRIASPDDKGYLILSMPPSVRRPHCVAVNAETVRYPLREGTHKRYLTESEIADLYRSRFADARTHAHQAQERHKAMVESLDRSERAWLVLSIEPDWPGRFTVTRSNTSELRTFGRTERVQFPTWFGSTTYDPSPSFRSLVLYDAQDRVYSSTARLHLDGGGSLAYGWEWRPRDALDEGPKVARIADEDIVGCLVNGIWALAQWAIDWAGTSGEATLLVELYAPEQYPMTLWQYRSSFPGELHGTRALDTDTGLVTMTVSLDELRSSGAASLLAARQVTSDLESAFGVLGPPQVSRDGDVRWKYFYRDKHVSLKQWAEAWNVEVLDDENQD